MIETNMGKEDSYNKRNLTLSIVLSSTFKLLMILHNVLQNLKQNT